MESHLLTNRFDYVTFAKDNPYCPPPIDYPCIIRVVRSFTMVYVFFYLEDAQKLLSIPKSDEGKVKAVDKSAINSEPDQPTPTRVSRKKTPKKGT